MDTRFDDLEHIRRLLKPEEETEYFSTYPSVGKTDLVPLSNQSLYPIELPKLELQTSYLASLDHFSGVATEWLHCRTPNEDRLTLETGVELREGGFFGKKRSLKASMNVTIHRRW